MSGRVLLSPSFIRVSRPGREVEGASLMSLLLDISVKQGQILQHGVIVLTPGAGGSTYGPWSGSTAIGPYPVVPDVKLGFIFSGGKQTMPAMQRIVAGRGFRSWQFSDISLTASTLSVSVAAQAVAVDGITPQPLVGINFIIFRKGIA